MQIPKSDELSLSGTAAPEPNVAVDLAGDAVDRIDVGWCEFRFTGRTALRTARILELCDGETTIEEIARRLAAPEATVGATVTALYTRGILRDTRRAQVPAGLFAEHAVARGRTLRTAMSSEVELLGAPPHRRFLLGTLVETYHFVASAPVHLGAAVAHVADAQVREALVRLFNDEADHGRMLRAGLVAAGLTEETIECSAPLPATRSVINFLRTLAATDLLSYAVCAAVNESPKTDTAIKKGWDELIALDLLPAEALLPFRGHELEDEESGHTAIAQAVFAERATLSAAEQRRICADLESFIAVQHGCYREMKEFYGAEAGPVAWGV